MSATTWEILYYRTVEGKCPFRDWLSELKDRTAQARIDVRIARLRALGHIGSCRAVGHGVFELKDPYGPGYRVYYALAGFKVILLLSGGAKDDQKADIAKAKQYLADHNRRQKAAGRHARR